MGRIVPLSQHATTPCKHSPGGHPDTWYNAVPLTTTRVENQVTEVHHGVKNWVIEIHHGVKNQVTEVHHGVKNQVTAVHCGVRSAVEFRRKWEARFLVLGIKRPEPTVVFIGVSEAVVVVSSNCVVRVQGARTLSVLLGMC